MKKISLVLVMCIIFSFAANVIASAEEYGVEPRLNNASEINCEFNVQNDVAIITAKVNGYSGTTSRISVNVLLEKRWLWGLFWTEVEEWNASSAYASDDFEFTKDVGSGTYRCTFEVTVEGSGGSADVYSKEIIVEN